MVVLVSGWGQSSHELWYEQPAQYFEESLVLGNGKMGASVFGGVASDKIYLNDITLWSGEPVDSNRNPKAHEYVPRVREALWAENYAQADSLNKFIQGSFSQSYAPLGTLYLHFRHQGAHHHYHRELDINQAISTLSYEVDGIRLQREYFISHPDKIMVIRLSSNAKAALNASIGFESLLKYSSTSEDDILRINGYAPYHAEPSYRGNMPDPVRFDENRGTRFSTFIKVKNTGGTLSYNSHSIELSQCDEAIIYISIATSFNGFDQNPATQGQDNQTLALGQLSSAFAQTYDALQDKHLRDYQALFNRVKLDLGSSQAPDLPTDERLKRYETGLEDKNLEILYFQFGRYLLIASSRTPEVPANLQGLWNPYLRPPWSSNYTLNINAEENYWLAESANLSELHQPLLSFIENLASTGAVTAKTFYGAEGWAACHNSDIWAMSNPVGDFGKGDPVWANWNMSGSWLSTHLWEHYLFSQDRVFLKEKAYPLMQGAARFCLDWMVADKQGHLITAPATSPENLYRTPEGYVGATLYGATADLAMIRELFQNTLQAAETLEIKDAFTRKVEKALQKLRPYHIGRDGSLQEWYHDWEDQDPQHRHQTHLFGLHPGHHIDPLETPELANACRQALEIKGDQTTGWSKGWRINLWARLWEGNRAYKMYRELLKYVPPDGVRVNYGGGGGTYPNLFDAHPPFQIDGNFGGAAAVIELLMQSKADKIYLLPALPDAWDSGTVQGICARGGFELDIEWKDHQLTRTAIRARVDGKTTLIFGDQQRALELKKGEVKEVIW